MSSSTLIDRIRSMPPVAFILIATAVSGLSGYLVTGLVAAVEGPSEYAVFAVFWSALYLIVGGLVGVQQEVTRAAHPQTPGNRARARARDFAIGGAIVVLVLVLASSVIWVPSVFPHDQVASAVVLALGTSCYVIVSTLSGVLYGLALWPFIALMVALDGLIRLVLVGSALLLRLGGLGLEVATVAPFVLVPLILWFWIRPRVVGRYQLDVGLGSLVWNVIRAVVAAAATAVLVSGFPLIVAATAGGAPSSELGVFLLAITLTRAPLVVTFLALQSYFVVLFRARGAGARSWRLMGLLIGGVSALTVVLAGLAWLLGEAVFVWIFGPAYAISGGTLALLVLTSGIVAVMSIAGSALLAHGAHSWFAASWIAAAGVMVLVMTLPGEIVPRSLAALAIGPATGAVIQLIGNLVVSRRAARASGHGNGVERLAE